MNVKNISRTVGLILLITGIFQLFPLLIAQISKIIFGSLFNPAMRILPAGGVAVEVSADGKQYTPVAEKALKHDYPETGRIAFTDSIEFEPTQATFLKVKIKNGGTLRNGVNFEKNNGPEVIPAELWIDEIEAY